MGTSLNLSKISQALSDRAKLFEGTVAKVGIPAGKHYPDGKSIAYIATIQEFGCPEKNIPPRTAYRSTIAKKSREWARTLAEGAEAVVKKRIGLNEMLEAAGHVAGMDVVQTIAERVPPPLKPATIAARVRRARKTNPKFGSKQLPVTISQPLNDTGTMIAHISSGTGKAGATFIGGEPVK